MAKLTVHGVLMSPRMERLWCFIQETHRIPLTDWSTDTSVEMNQKALRAALADAQARAAANPKDETAAALARDVEVLCNRRPQARAEGGSTAAAQARAASGATNRERTVDVAAPVNNAGGSSDGGWGSSGGW